MSQYDFGVIDPANTSGTQLAEILGNFRDALNSTHGGVSRPSYAVAALMWVDTSDSVPVLNYFDGVNDRKLFEIQAAGGKAADAEKLDGKSPGDFMSRRTDMLGWTVGAIPFFFGTGGNEDSYHHDDSVNTHIFRSDATPGNMDDLGSSRVKAAFADFEEWRHAEGLKVGQFGGVHGIRIGMDESNNTVSGRLFFESSESNWAIVNWNGELRMTHGGTYGSSTGSAKFRFGSDGALQATSVAGSWVASKPEAEAGTNDDQIMTPLRTADSIAANQAVRAWVNFDGTGTPTIRASQNVTSLTDNGTGDYSVNFVTPFSDTNYTMHSGAVRASDGTIGMAGLVGGYNSALVGKLTGSCRIRTGSTTGVGLADLQNVYVAFIA